jgi:hypothetical protein
MLSIRSAQEIGNLFRTGLAALAALTTLLVLQAWAPPAGNAATSAQGESCPLTTPVYKASLDARKYTAAVGATAHLRVRLTPAGVPDGFFVTSIIDVLSGPPGPKPHILTGHPVSDVTPRAPGTYRLRVLVNLIAKSSCGGVKAVTLLDREVVLVAK